MLWEQLLALVAVVFIAAGTVFGYRSWRRNKMDWSLAFDYGFMIEFSCISIFTIILWQTMMSWNDLER